MEMVLELFFLAFSNGDFQFGIEKLTWRSYTVAEALPTTSQIELINKTVFVKVVLDKNFETFVIYMAALEAEALIYLLQPAQIATL